MSWFSRNWDGVHLEGCAVRCPDCEVGCSLADHVGIRDLDWFDMRTEDAFTAGNLNPCNDCCECKGEFKPHVVVRYCTCPELMTERAVGAAEMQRDAIKEQGL